MIFAEVPVATGRPGVMVTAAVVVTPDPAGAMAAETAEAMAEVAMAVTVAVAVIARRI